MTTHGLDRRDVELILTQLALLHATSHHFLENYPGGGRDRFRRDHPVSDSVAR